mmetsp:Transcript_37337/g.120618  ORF Transcript_37337/g.120618 Transcript_37337/m.120618 type:complete len:325 (+) Transcript_37337:1050-2024(+)
MPPHGLEKLAPDVEEVAAAAGRATLRSASRRRGQRREARHGRRGPRRRGRRGRGRDGEWRRGGALGQALEGRLLVRLGREVDKEAARDGSLDRLDSNPLAVVDRLRVCCAVGGEVEDVVRYRVADRGEDHRLEQPVRQGGEGQVVERVDAAPPARLSRLVHNLARAREPVTPRLDHRARDALELWPHRPLLEAAQGDEGDRLRREDVEARLDRLRSELARTRVDSARRHLAKQLAEEQRLARRRRFASGLPRGDVDGHELRVGRGEHPLVKRGRPDRREAGLAERRRHALCVSEDCGAVVKQQGCGGGLSCRHSRLRLRRRPPG